MSARPRGLVAIGLGALSVASAALAQPTRPALSLAFASCETLDTREVRRIVGIELRAGLGPSAENAIATSVRVTCRDTTVGIEVDDRATGKSLSREVSVERVEQSVRARLLALAIAELVSASWTELESTPRPSLSPTSATAPPEQKRAALGTLRARSKRLVRLGVLATARAFPPELEPLWGGALELRHRAWGAFGYRVDLALDHGVLPAEIGEVSVTTASSAISLMAAHDASWGGFGAGLGGRAGIAWLSGTADEPARIEGRSGSAWWAGPAAFVEAGVRPAERMVLGCVLEAGYALTDIQGRVDTAADLRLRRWVSLGLGIGIDF